MEKSSKILSNLDKNNTDNTSDSEVFHFFWNLFNRSREKNKDSIISPVSVFLALGMVAEGAAGNTLDQIQDVLGMDSDQINDLSRYFLNLAESDKHSQFKAADSVWINDSLDFRFSEKYIAALKKYYDASAETIPFNKNGVKTINEWISEKTEGQIQEIINNLEDLNAVLVNALSFKGVWLEVFTRYDIRNQKFTDSSGDKETVQMMHSHESDFIETEFLKGFIKPYEKYRFGFIAMLPKGRKKLETALAETDAESLMEAIRNPIDADVSIAIPSFKLDQETEMNRVLTSLGITDIFCDYKADLSRMTDGKAELKISEVLHQAKIAVNSTGTEAAAVSAVAACCLGLPEERRTEKVICNRPFLFMVADLKSGIPMFMGTLQSIPVSAESESAQDWDDSDFLF